MRRAWLAAAFVSVVLVAASIGVFVVGPRPAHADSFTVNSTGDGADFALDGRCDADPRATVVRCTLRAAIQEANNRIAHPGADTINFNIPTTDPNCNPTNQVCTISPVSALPKITEAVSIDGYSQPGASENTLAVGDNAVLKIQLSGANVGSSAYGLETDASNSVVKGLAINRFAVGIVVRGENNTIEGSFMGTSAGGNVDRGNLFNAVGIGGNNNTVGGTSPEARNLISGNDQDGVVISGSANQVLGNLVGTDRTGTLPLGNDASGVDLLSKNNTVGGVIPAAANVIAFNGADGVSVPDSDAIGNRILGNSIFSNADLGIDLGDDGRTANDRGDLDSGPNNLQNFPTITSATTSTGTSLTVRGNLNSRPNKTFTIEFFSNPDGDEGKTFLARRTVTTNILGIAVFNFTFAADVVTGERVTATATGPGGNTSEFSASRLVREP